MANIVNMEPTALLGALAFTLRRQEDNERHRLERQQLRLQERDLRMRQNAAAQQAQAEANRAVQSAIGSLSDTLGDISKMYAQRKQANALAAYRGEQLGLQREKWGEQLGLQREKMEQTGQLAYMQQAAIDQRTQEKAIEAETAAHIKRGDRPVLSPENEATYQALEKQLIAANEDYRAGNMSGQEHRQITGPIRDQMASIKSQTQWQPKLITELLTQGMQFFPGNKETRMPGFWAFRGAGDAIHILQQRHETGGDATAQRQQTSARRKLYLDEYDNAQDENFLRDEPYPESEVSAEARRNAINRERFLKSLGLETGSQTYEGYEARAQQDQTTTDEEDRVREEEE